MKFCTDIKQSNELLEIGLSLETADMYWELDKNCSIEAYNLVPLIRYSTKERKELFEKDKELIPCWSLAALLSVLPEPELIQNQEGTWLLRIWDSKRFPWSVGGYINPVDACYEMIVKLKYENLL